MQHLVKSIHEKSKECEVLQFWSVKFVVNLIQDVLHVKCQKKIVIRQLTFA